MEKRVDYQALVAKRARHGVCWQLKIIDYRSQSCGGTTDE